MISLKETAWKLENKGVLLHSFSKHNYGERDVIAWLQYTWKYMSVKTLQQAYNHINK